MTVAEAKKIVDGKSLKSEFSEWINHAEGYLEGYNSKEALERPEVKALVKQMEREIEINDHARNCLSAGLQPCDCHISRLMQALAQYYRVVKK